MNFGFDGTQRSLGDTVARLLQSVPALTAPDLDPRQSDRVYEMLAECGLFALLVPESCGGTGLSLVDTALAVESLGGGLAPPAVIATLAATDAIVRHGHEGQRRELLPKIASGELRVAIALLEPGCGYDPHTMKSTIANGRLTGRKLLVPGAAEADLLLIVTGSGGKPTLALLDARSGGVATQVQESLDPTADFHEVVLKNVAVRPESLLGGASPERAVERLMDVSATLHAGMLMGIAAQMLHKTVEYAKIRVQFGQAIGAFQAIKHRCADMAVAVEAGQSAAYYAFWAIAEDSSDSPRAAAMAKSYCGEVARMVCNEAIQVHGGMGFTWELGLHRYLRRAKVLEHAFGEGAWHNERIVAATLAALIPETNRQWEVA
ncbi:MAG: acyl-CoA dehydrogenase [Rhodospirillaceae bacterium]|nr:MAG: acyl-CoA dehydrogenase [Rhodospirillaceae bacterium]